MIAGTYYDNVDGGPSSTTVTIEYDQSDYVETVDSLAVEVREIEAVLQRQSWFFYEQAGGVCGWRFCRRIEQWVYIFLYWAWVLIEIWCNQVHKRRRLGYWSGLMDWTRGRHWDRRRRYGLR